jgi:hypothetical protein
LALSTGNALLFCQFFAFPTSAPGLGCIFRIPDPTTTEERREEKIICVAFFRAINFSKIKIILDLTLEQVQKNYWPIDKVLIFFTQQIFTKLSEIWHRDRDQGSENQGSGKKLILDPGSGSKRQKKQPDS